jgi:hypothetical protein
MADGEFMRDGGAFWTARILRATVGTVVCAC